VPLGSIRKWMPASTMSPGRASFVRQDEAGPVWGGLSGCRHEPDEGNDQRSQQWSHDPIDAPTAGNIKLLLLQALEGVR